MKTKVLVVLLWGLGMSSGLFAQQQTEEQRRARFEKFQAERVDFITKAVGLTDEEGSAFWQIVNDLQTQKFELNKPLREELRKIREAKRKNATVSEAQYKKVIELKNSIRIKEAQLDQEYSTKLLKVVSAEKVFLYQNAEQEFGQKALESRRGRNTQSSLHNRSQKTEKSADARRTPRRNHTKV